jgi:hypothetical protein
MSLRKNRPKFDPTHYCRNNHMGIVLAWGKTNLYASGVIFNKIGQVSNSSTGEISPNLATLQIVFKTRKKKVQLLKFVTTHQNTSHKLLF